MPVFNKKDGETMDKTRKQLESDYAGIMLKLGIVKSQGIGQHVKDYVKSNPTVSKTQAREIVRLNYVNLDEARARAWVTLINHKDTLLSEQVFTKSACLRVRSKAATVIAAAPKTTKKATKPVSKKTRKKAQNKKNKTNKKS